jgi:hypothetical protein
MASPQEVRNQFVDSDGWPNASPVPLQHVRAWMADPSLEVRGALYYFLCARPDLCRLDTLPSEEELFCFLTTFFRDCLATPEEQVNESRYILGGVHLTHTIAYWAYDFWRGHRWETDRARLTSWLRSALLDFPQYTELLATALGDHFLSDRRIRKHFSAWAADPELVALLPELTE